MKVLILIAVFIAGSLAMPTPGHYGGGGYGGGYGGGHGRGYGGGHGGGYGGGGYGHGSGNSNIYHSQQFDHYGYSGPYKFGYTVSDPYTGDYHGRHEQGNGYGGVTGSYHVREPNGHVREVKYVADYGGFRAYVNGVPHGYSGGGYH